ncbi:MAG: ABC transporter ATP-binding protein [Alphaproteobacteria bacterium]|nr:ABC transporter ATP-binding protein [Alphaproteobacteria bacterium]
MTAESLLPHVRLEGISHHFGGQPVLKDISLDAYKGEVLGLIGPNGAGKSTTMRIVTGYLTPVQGRVTICGHDMATQSVQARRSLGYLPEGAALWDEWTVWHFLHCIAAIRGLRGKEKNDRFDVVVAETSLQQVLHQTIETLSKGFRRRVALAAALIGDPDVLVLDEPTDGLDPNQKHEMRKLIRTLAQEKAIILSTHILEEVPALCTRLITIANGQIVSSSTPEEFAALASAQTQGDRQVYDTAVLEEAFRLLTTS